MNTDDVRRRLEALGAAMEWIVLVPLDTKVGGGNRTDKYNLVETPDGYHVGMYERGKMRPGVHYSDLAAACRKVAEISRRMAADHRAHQARMQRWQREATEKGQTKD